MDALAGLLNSNGLRVAAYAVAALLCVAAAVRERSVSNNWRVPAFWFAIAAVMFVLAASRMVELGPLISEEGREFAKDRGWYDDRREYQRLAVEGIAAGGFLLGAAGFVWLFASAARQYPLALIAVVFLVCYVLVRAISLHQVDAVLYNRPIEGIRINALLELAGIALMSVAALLALLSSTRLNMRSASTPA